MSRNSNTTARSAVATTPVKGPAEGHLRDRVLQAGIDVFYEEGFSGATMRQIVARAEAQMSSVYYHFPSKQHLLFEIMDRTLRDSADYLRRGLDEAGQDDDPVSQLRAALTAQIEWHTIRQREAFIAEAELNRLHPPFREQIIALRDAQELMVREIVDAGVACGQLCTSDAAMITRLLLTACTAVASWYRWDGPDDAATIAAVLFEAAVNGMRAR